MAGAIQDNDTVNVSNSNFHVIIEEDVNNPLNVLSTFTNSNIYFTNESLDVSILNTVQVNNNTSFEVPDFVELTNSNINFNNEKVDVEVKNIETIRYDSTQVVTNQFTYLDLFADTSFNRLRNQTTISGSATITKSIGSAPYYTLTTTANGSDSVAISSREHSAFQLFDSVVFLLSFTSGTTFTGNNVAYLGAMDSDLNDGWYFSIESDDLYVNIAVNGTVVQRQSRDNFSFDTFDGTGPSGINWSNVGSLPFTDDIVIYAIKFDDYFQRITFGFYKGGVFFPGTQILTVDALNEFPRYSNAQLTVKLDNGGTATALTAFIGHRLIHVEGGINIIPRLTSVRRDEIGFYSVTSTSFTPILSIRKKIAYQHINIKIKGFSYYVSNTVQIGFFLNTPLNNSTFIDVIDTDPEETALEFNEDATTMTLSSSTGDGRIMLYSQIISGGSNAGGRTSGDVDLTKYRLNMGPRDVISVGARSYGSNADLGLIIDVEEVW